MRYEREKWQWVKETQQRDSLGSEFHSRFTEQVNQQPCCGVTSLRWHLTLYVPTAKGMTATVHLWPRNSDQTVCKIFPTVGSVRATVFLMACVNFYLHFSNLLSDLREILYTRSERDAVQHYEFSENRYGENQTSLKGAHEILSLHTTFFVRVRYNSTMEVNKKRCVRISWKSHREGCVLPKGVNKITFTDWSQCRKHSATLFQYACTWDILAAVQGSMRRVVCRDVMKCGQCRIHSRTARSLPYVQSPPLADTGTTELQCRQSQRCCVQQVPLLACRSDNEKHDERLNKGLGTGLLHHKCQN